MANGNFAGGTGVSGDPYLIEDVLDLDAVRNDSSAHYKLIADIDLQGFDPNGDGTGWNPIGDIDNEFSGVFDGDGKAIKNLYIDRGTIDYQGLFGCVTVYSTIKNLRVVDVSIKVYTNNHVGAIIAYVTNGYISNCLSTGSIIRTNNTYHYSGGIAGTAISTNFSNCYSWVDISGGNSIGGLIGNCLGGSIINCYSKGSVSGGTNYIGGLVGRTNNEVAVTNLFWDTETSGQATSVYGTGLTTAQMQTAQTFIDAGWDTSIWALKNGHYPKFWFEVITKHLIKSSNKIQVLSNGEWLDTGLNEPLTKADFEEFGMDDLSLIPSEKWNELDEEFEVITWTDADSPPQIEITVPPFRPLDKLDNQFSIIMGEYEPE